MYAISTLGDIGSLGEAVTGASALVALVLGGRQLSHGRKLARKSAVAAYVEKVNSKEIQRLLSASADYWGVPERERDARWKEWRSLPRAMQQDAFLAMNVFETLGAMYNDRVVDRRATQRLLGAASLDYWDIVSWFVKRYQQLDREALVEWERMNQDLVSSRPADVRGEEGGQDNPAKESNNHNEDEPDTEDEDDSRERGRPWETGDLFLVTPRAQPDWEDGTDIPAP